MRVARIPYVLFFARTATAGCGDQHRQTAGGPNGSDRAERRVVAGSRQRAAPFASEKASGFSSAAVPEPPSSFKPSAFTASNAS